MIGILTYGDTVSESIKEGHLNTDTVVNGYSVQIIDEAGNILVGPSVGLADITYGLVVLCLSQYFAYGAKLEKDVEGLL